VERAVTVPHAAPLSVSHSRRDSIAVVEVVVAIAMTMTRA
jgi:hypothetical protein